MPTVIYGRYRVSDTRIKEKLQSIAEILGRDIRITSGDRTKIVKGSSRKSLHLINEAVDFHVAGLSDTMAFRMIREDRVTIFGEEAGQDFRWQLIQHGSHTKTGGPHLHLGISPLDGPLVYRGFVVEGVVAGQPYTVVEGP